MSTLITKAVSTCYSAATHIFNDTARFVNQGVNKLNSHTEIMYVEWVAALPSVSMVTEQRYGCMYGGREMYVDVMNYGLCVAEN